MILWCPKCHEYRKRNSHEWDECRYTHHHIMVPAHEKFNNEINELRERIAAAEGSASDDAKPNDPASKDAKPNDLELANPDMDADRRKLGMLEAIKNSMVDDRLGSESVQAIVEEIVRDGLYDEHGGTFFWIGDGKTWDLLRHNSKALESVVSATHARRYGDAGRLFGVRDSIEARADILRLDRSKRAVAAGKRAVFADGRLWVDLGGEPRNVYVISADDHGPAVPYKPGARVILERHGMALPAPKSKKGGWLEMFCGLLRIEPERRRTFAAHICHMFCMHRETPAMVLDAGGADGAHSAEVTAARLVKELVDPVGFGRAVMMAPMGIHQLEGALESPVLAFAYAGSMQQDVSRCLAAAREGMALPGGKLYGYARIIFAGDTNTSVKINRYSMQTVPESDAPEDLLKRLDDMKPHLLYEMFGVIHDAFGSAAARSARPGAVSFDDMVCAVGNKVSGQPA